MRKEIYEAIKTKNKEKLTELLANAEKGLKINLQCGRDEVLYEKSEKTWKYTRWDNGMMTYSAGNQRTTTVIVGLINAGCGVTVKVK